MTIAAGRENQETRTPMLRDPVGPPRAWTRDSLAADGAALFYDLTGEAREEIADALRRIKVRDLDLQTVTQEDFRIPAFARDVAALRQRLDDGAGFVIIRGIDVEAFSEEQATIIYWGLGNYLGQVVRQDVGGSRTDFVSDKGTDESAGRPKVGGSIEEGSFDPYRVIDTNRFCALHTDNAYSNPRPPDYIGLMCLRNAARGGESLLISAYTIHNEILKHHPQYLDRLYADFHWDTPAMQTLPDGPSTAMQPIFEIKDDDLVIHYLDMYLQPGMEIAGTPMTAKELSMQAFIDDLMLREDLRYKYRLQPGEVLFSNNRWTLHGREAFTDPADPARGRKLVRLWMWRRHIGPGMDPVALDTREFRLTLE